MTETQRKIKKLYIIGIVLFFVAITAWVLYKPEERTCFNGIKDVGEEGIDCGGFCEKECPPPDKPPTVQDISVKWVKFVEDGKNNYDLVAKISNSNESWGVSAVSYKFNIYSKEGEIIDTVSGKSYIMPKGFLKNSNSRYIIENNFKTGEDIEKVSLELYNFNWREVKNLRELPELDVEIIRIINKDHGFVEDGKEFYYAFGVTENISKYSFFKVDINIVIFDDYGELVAAGKTDQWTLTSGAGWEFKIFWTSPFSETIGIVDYEAQTNVFDIGNFMDVYGTGGKYIIPK
jgi:hypothetical protein